jgi:hypothetical protein
VPPRDDAYEHVARSLKGHDEYCQAARHFADATQRAVAMPRDQRLWHLLQGIACQQRSDAAASAAGCPPHRYRPYTALYPTTGAFAAASSARRVPPPAS